MSYKEKLTKNVKIIIILISVLLWSFYLSYYSSVLIEAGGMEYAQIAYNLYQGNGFKTNLILPFRLNFVSSDKNLDNLFYPFKYGISHPVIILIFLKLFGVNDFSVVFSSAIFYFIITLVLFIFTKELFSLKVAIVASLIFTFNSTILTWVMWGNPDPLLTFLLFLSLLILIKNRDTLLAGFIFSICGITRLHAYFYLPGIILFIIFFYSKKRFTAILRFFVGLAPVIIIFLVWQYFNKGLPFLTFSGNYMALFTPTYPGPQSLRTIELIPFWEFIITHPMDIIAKIKFSLYNFITFFPLITNPYLMAFFICGIFFGYNNTQKDRYKFLIIFFIFSTIFFYLISISYIERYILTLLPFIIIIASDFIVRLYDTFTSKKIIILIPFIILIIHPLFFDIYNLMLNRKGIEEIKELNRMVGKISQDNFKSDDFIISDSPWIVAWYGKRNCIWLPLSPDDIKKIEEKIKIKGIILTSLYYPQTELDTPSLWLTKFIEPIGRNNWTEIFEGKEQLQGFERRKAIKLKEFSIVYFKKKR